ncbi:putative nuclease of restriction endonuclease-like (RecB) superfamily [Nakamurella sp. UYEF19]
MRKLAASWPEAAIVQQPAGQLPWGHLMVLLDRFDEQTDRDWYAARADEAGWSRKVLEHHIATGLHPRLGSGITNFADQLAPADSYLAREMVKDPGLGRLGGSGSAGAGAADVQRG